MPLRRTWIVGILSFVLHARGEDAVDYLRDVKPIFAARCYACHGALKQKAGLRLDTGEFIRRGAKDGPIIESELMRRITSSDTDERMPVEGEPLKPEQIRMIEAWLRTGAQSPAGEKPEPDPREHWAFKPPVRAEISGFGSRVSGSTNPKPNPIDSLIDGDLTPQPLADKPALLRRVSLDLIGLPPTRDELRAFLADDAPDAYDRAVDRLLHDPRHGERWARHWMDVWRYSDWYGRRLVPDVWNSAPQVWRWRDWIVRSLNAGKGYDRMVTEMLAADEIAPGDDESRVATGYLVRNWYALNPNQWMRDNVEHTAKAFLGLTFNCAHCHDHKYDPITQQDYFHLRAFFEPIYVRQDRVPGEADPGAYQDYDYSKLRKIVRTGMVSVFDKDAAAKTWFYTGGDERNRQTDRPPAQPAPPAFLGGEVRVEPVKLPLSVSFPGAKPFAREDETRAAEKAIANARAQLKTAEVALAAANEKFSVTLDESAAQDAELAMRLAQAALVAARAKRDSLKARVAADDVKFLGKPGDLAAVAKTAGESERALALAVAKVAAIEAERAVRAAKPDEKKKADAELANATKALAKAEDDAKKPATDYTPLSPTYPHESTGRRLALARWIASRKNPLTARVAVNHIWMRHFHTPLVASVYDFGRNGSPPTHPELLDWLAVEFMENGWSMKHLHRLIVTSAAYQRASMSPGRMEAEVVRDSMLHLAGKLDARMGGQELETAAMPGSNRRSLYFACYPEGGGSGEFTGVFDAPDPNDCYRRTQSIVPQQALALTNSKFVHDCSEAIARRLTGEGAEFITVAFEHLLTRPPKREETDACLAFLTKQPDPGRARESLIRALFNHHEFVTVR
ncbi:MAG: DUF1553 domain-containing protein [Chthoniobacteraceae bacterium]